MQFHAARLDEWLGPLNSHVTTFLEQRRSVFAHQTSDATGASHLALQSLDSLRQQQASSLAYFDVFWTAAALAVGLVLLVLIMKRSVAEKGARVGAE